LVSACPFIGQNPAKSKTYRGLDAHVCSSIGETAV